MMEKRMMEKIKAQIKDYMQGLLSIMEEEATFEIQGQTPEDIYINITGNIFSIPEERPILTSLERLLQAYLDRETETECKVVIDTNGAIKRKKAALIRFALTAAESARKEHKRIRLNPMSARERRTIHVTLASFPAVKTYSIGKGDQRRVVIEPSQI
ncbi:hypothetical protein D4R47_02720 [archaeon]|nr:MAG: hypothetical protein D4R47_02720 [archaeon]